MNPVTDTLTPAEELARGNSVRIPNERGVPARARTALLAEEIELRRHIERVAAQRRALPPGGDVEGLGAFSLGRSASNAKRPGPHLCDPGPVRIA
jgi:uncharacterized protein DUF899